VSIYFKLVDADDKGNVKTLFHGVNGSRVLDTTKWIDSEQKQVRDGSSATWYTSGWHILPTFQSCLDYLRKFKHLKQKRVVMCLAQGIWPKEHSRDEVYLARRIRVISQPISVKPS
jgi:hypothetical protein